MNRLIILAFTFLLVGCSSSKETNTKTTKTETNTLAPNRVAKRVAPPEAMVKTISPSNDKKFKKVETAKKAKTVKKVGTVKKVQRLQKVENLKRAEEINKATIINVPKPKNLKLKISLTDIQSLAHHDEGAWFGAINDATSNDIADLGVIQRVLYKANGKGVKVIDTDRTWFPDRNCNEPNAPALICGNSKNQIHIKADSKGNRKYNIGNSVTFEITPAVYNDKNAEMTIYTWVKEYNGDGDDILLNHDRPYTKVDIRKVLDILKGLRPLNMTHEFRGDNAIAKKGWDPLPKGQKRVKFDYFDGSGLPITKVANYDKMILEGVIRARDKSKSGDEKAQLWIRFELMD